MMADMVIGPPRRIYDPYRIPLSISFILFALSLALHLSLTFLPWPLASNLKRDDSTVPVVTVNLSPHVDIQDSLQETAKEKPKDVHFESSRNLKADEDTSAASGSSVVSKRGEKIRERAQTKAPSKSKSADGKTILRFSSDDLKEEARHEKQAREKGLGDQFDSAGFNERLKKARELKISAVESDRGQFITRMQRKISQHWSPLKTVNSSMYNYDAVTVEIAVILDRAGELQKLVVTDASLFADYDNETLRALKEAAPYPNPPKSLIGSDGLVMVPWQFTLYLRRAMFAVQ